MKTKAKLGAGALLLFVSAYGILACHDLLARLLAGQPLLEGWSSMPPRLATLVALLFATGCIGVFILPVARNARWLGVSPAAANIAIGTAMLEAAGRAVAEFVAGMLVVGYPLVPAALLMAAIAVGLAPRLPASALGTHVVLGRNISWKRSTDSGPFRTSA